MLFLAIVGIFQTLFIATFFITRKIKKFSDYIILSLTGIILLIFISEIVIKFFENKSLLTYFTTIAYPLTFGPFLYLYTKAEIMPNFRFSFRQLKHFMPAVIISIVYLSMIYTNTIEDILLMPSPRRQGFHEFRPEHPGRPPLQIENNFDRPVPPHDPRFANSNRPNPFVPEKITGKAIIGIFFKMSLIISLLIYTIAIMRLINRHKDNIKNFYSFESYKVNLKWLTVIAWFFFFLFIYVYFITTFMPYIYKNQFFDPRATFLTGIIIFLYMFGFFAINQPYLFTEKKITPEPESKTKYERSGLKQEDTERYLKEIEVYMLEEKPYLDGDLTINEISNDLDIPKHYITQIINNVLNKNFYTFVNEYRFNEARERLLCDKYQDHTVLQIAFDSGFNSKSVFNNFFKKNTKLTPSEFRKKYSAQSA